MVGRSCCTVAVAAGRLLEAEGPEEDLLQALVPALRGVDVALRQPARLDEEAAHVPHRDDLQLPWNVNFKYTPK